MEPSPSSLNDLVLHRYQRSNQGFIEDLGSGVTLTLMLIPEGEFWMGSSNDELYSQNTERPQHLVSMSKFLMGKYPITQAQWKTVARLSRIDRNLKTSPSYFIGERCPVEQVSWYEAVEFCKRLSAYTGRNYGLPSEAEWEYACRAGTMTPFHFGEMLTTEIANYYQANETERKYPVETTSVDFFGLANQWGLCDMHGNVWEWCQDYQHYNYDGAPNDGTAWLTANKNTARVVRGGSWSYDHRRCRSASRHSYMPEQNHSKLGFRIVCRA